MLVRDGLRLRPAQFEDGEAWTALRERSRAHLTAWEPAWRADEMTPQAFRQRVRSYWREIRNGTGLPLLVFAEEGEKLVGGVSLSNIRYGASRSAGVGYWIGAPFTGKGFGRAALSAVVDYAFSTLELNRVEAACQPENLASQRLLRSAGFAQEGFAPDYLKINGAWRDHVLFAVTARQFGAGAGN